MTAPARPARRLSEHIHDALLAMAERVLTEHPEHQDELAEWLETAHERIVCVPAIDRPRRRKGRRYDLRSLRIDVQLYTDAGPAPLVSLRVRDLVTADGAPVATTADARDLLLQNGIGIPDDASAIAQDGGQQ